MMAYTVVWNGAMERERHAAECRTVQPAPRPRGEDLLVVIVARPCLSQRALSNVTGRSVKLINDHLLSLRRRGLVECVFPLKRGRRPDQPQLYRATTKGQTYAAEITR